MPTFIELTRRRDHRSNACNVRRGLGPAVLRRRVLWVMSPGGYLSELSMQHITAKALRQYVDPSNLLSLALFSDRNVLHLRQ